MVRGEPRERAILSATIEVLEAEGYEAMTIDGVAARAHASKATIYRRWPNKAALVKAALDALDRDDNAAIPDTGALRSDLLAVMKAMGKKASAPYLRMIQDLVAAARRDPLLASLLQEHIANDELSPFQSVIHRAVLRGELPKSTDTVLVHDVAEALMLRQAQTGAPFDARFVRRVVDQVLLPLLEKKRGRS